jgi:hypothetical protein
MGIPFPFYLRTLKTRRIMKSVILEYPEVYIEQNEFTYERYREIKLNV